MSTVKRKLKTLNLAEKLEVLEAVKSCKKKKDVAEQFGLPMSTLSTIIKNESNIMKKIQNTQNLSCKRRRITKFLKLEDSLLKWFTLCLNQNISVSGRLLQEKAQTYSKSLGINNFRASNGWLDKFKKRHKLVLNQVCEEGATDNIEIEICKIWKSELKGLLHGYEPHNIFNAGEMGLFFKCLPDKIPTFRNEKCCDGRLSKERLTILLAANMSGTEKLPPLVIGKVKTPRCFARCTSLPLKYQANKKAWITSTIFKNWLINIDRKMAEQKREILLFIDYCTAHNDIPQMKAVKVQYLPYTTSKLQPMNQGIIKNFKALYRKEVLRNMLNNIEKDKNFTIDVLQAMRMADKAWRNVTANIIKNCYAYCGFPSLSIEEVEIEDTSIPPPTEWYIVVSDSEISFEDFVMCDDEVVTSGTSSDDNIDSVSQKTATNHVDGIEDSNNTTCAQWVSIEDARTALNTLRNFIEQTSNAEEQEFAALHTIDNAIDREQHTKYLAQANNNDLF